jgi:hypothetical protein
MNGFVGKNNSLRAQFHSIFRNLEEELYPDKENEKIESLKVFIRIFFCGCLQSVPRRRIVRNDDNRRVNMERPWFST